MAPVVIYNDEWTWEYIYDCLYEKKAFDNIVISPGPGSPMCADDIGQYLVFTSFHDCLKFDLQECFYAPMIENSHFCCRCLFAYTTRVRRYSNIRCLSRPPGNCFVISLFSFNSD